ncbi:MAG TPA: AI-2E family transporter [Candidatus Limnocylindrales bacterium]|nr:AI-2E family transporter [Candidatus Limnocylindrales bacterium]
MNGLPALQRWWVTYVLVAAAAIVAVVHALLALGQILGPLRHFILIVVFAVVIAFLLSPLADLIQRLVRRRTVAVLISFFVAVAIVISIIALLGVPLVQESRTLVRQLPEWSARLQSPEPFAVLGFEIPQDVRVRVGGAISERASEIASQAATVVIRVVGAVTDIVLTFVLAAYLLAAAPRIRAGVLRLLPARYRLQVEHVEDETARLFGAYVRAQLLLGVIVGVLSGIAFGLLGVPYALFLAVLAGVLELVPIIGPIIAGVMAGLVALTEPFPLVVWVLLAAFAIQQLENQLLVPRISGGAVGIPPVAALIAVLFGLEVAGLVGAIFAVPLAGLLATLAGGALRAWRDRQAAKAPADA